MCETNICFAISVQKSVPDANCPWKERLQNSRGTAFVLSTSIFPRTSNTWLLTNEHVIRNSTHISIDNSAESVSLVFASKAHDLAILSVSMSCQATIRFAKQIVLGEEITIVGYPQGSNNQSRSGGFINRLVELNYNGVEPNVIFQLSTASDLGSSGSPVFNKANELVGIASYKSISVGLADIRDACFMIPFTIVQHFLEMFRRSLKPSALPNLAILISRAVSPTLRRHYSLDQVPLTSNKGVLITKSNIAELRHGDVLLSIDNHEISATGTCRCDILGDFVPYWYFIKCHYPGDQLHVQILRNLVLLNITIELQECALPQESTTFAQYKNLTFTEISNIVMLAEARLSDATIGYKLEPNKILVKLNDMYIEDLSSFSSLDSNMTNKFEFADGDIVIL